MKSDNEQGFIDIIKKIKQEYFSPYNKITSDPDARRIAILITDEFLKFRGNREINRFMCMAADFEREIYEGVKNLKLQCNLIPEEIRIQEEVPLKSRKNFNPLRLVSEPHRCPLKRTSQLGKTVLEILERGEEDAETSEATSDVSFTREGMDSGECVSVLS